MGKVVVMSNGRPWEVGEGRGYPIAIFSCMEEARPIFEKRVKMIQSLYGDRAKRCDNFPYLSEVEVGEYQEYPYFRVAVDQDGRISGKDVYFAFIPPDFQNLNRLDMAVRVGRRDSTFIAYAESFEQALALAKALRKGYYDGVRAAEQLPLGVLRVDRAVPVPVAAMNPADEAPFNWRPLEREQEVGFVEFQDNQRREG